jgi:alkylhydroperoxidase family enzyme
MAHVTLTDDRKGAIPRLARAYAKKRFGQSVEPAQAAAHHSGVLVAMGALETAVDKGWKKFDPELRWLAIQAVAGLIGCSWCIDYGYYEGMHAGIDPRKVREAATWRQSTLFDERERAVLEYAEQATATPAAVSDDCVRNLHQHFSEAQIVELAAWVALENFRSRFNAGLGLHSQGFAEACAVPLARSASASASIRSDGVAS